MRSQWYYRDAAREVGPLSLADLAVMARGGRLTAETLVREGLRGNWIAAGRVPQLFPAAGAGHRDGPPPLPTPTDRVPADIGPARLNPRRGKLTAGADASLVIGSLCLAGVAAAVVLVVVLFLAHRDRDEAAGARPASAVHLDRQPDPAPAAESAGGGHSDSSVTSGLAAR